MSGLLKAMFSRHILRVCALCWALLRRLHDHHLQQMQPSRDPKRIQGNAALHPVPQGRWFLGTITASSIFIE
jgi:hypothetical protein